MGSETAIIADLQREMFGDPVHLYCLAGNATFTIRSIATGKRYTYKIQKAAENPRFPGDTWFVSLLNGGDNESSFVSFGMLKPQEWQGGKAFDYIHLKPGRGRPSRQTESVKAFVFFWNHLDHSKHVHPGLEFFHSGRCGRCGRKLTVPESIQSGFGPECAGRLGG